MNIYLFIFITNNSSFVSNYQSVRDVAVVAYQRWRWSHSFHLSSNELMSRRPEMCHQSVPTPITNNAPWLKKIHHVPCPWWSTASTQQKNLTPAMWLPPSAKAGHRCNSHQPWRRRPGFGFTPTTTVKESVKREFQGDKPLKQDDARSLSLPFGEGYKGTHIAEPPWLHKHLHTHTHTAYFKHTSIARRIAFAFPAGTCNQALFSRFYSSSAIDGVPSFFDQRKLRREV